MNPSRSEQSLTPAQPNDSILSRIAVRHPYFALEDLKRAGEGELSAALPPIDQPMDCECGVRAAAEIGRHLAILGACAAAELNKKDGQHYYLAKKAHLRATESYQHRVAQGKWDGLSNAALMGLATAAFTANRSATADMRIIAESDGEELYKLEVDYMVLSAKAFERLFSEHRMNNFEFDQHARQAAITFDELVEDLVLLDDMLSARFGFQPSTCLGHFPAFPALPVAVLMLILSKAAGKLLEEITGTKDVRYVVLEAIVEAENLAFPSDKVYLVVQHTNKDAADGRYCFRCRAVAEGKNVHKFGEMSLILQTEPNDQLDSADGDIRASDMNRRPVSS